MGLEVSLCGFRDVIEMSFCGSRDVILRVYRCHFMGLEMSFCGSKDVISWV